MDNLDNYDRMSLQEKWYILAMVANLYYNCNLTQNQIADRIYISRSKVSRLLKEARELGIVEIYIRELWERELDCEQFLKERFGLKNIRVIKNKGMNRDEEFSRLCEAAAYYMDSAIEKDMVLGISWGSTLHNIVKCISRKNRKNIPITVVSIMGAVHMKNPEWDATDLTKNLAQAYGGQYHYLYAPLFVKNSEIRKSLIEEEHIKEVLGMASKADLMLSSVGSISDRSWKTLFRDDVWEILENKGVVGYIGGHFYDINGKEVTTSLRDRMIGVSLEDMKNCKNLICVAFGEGKAEAVQGALQGEFVDMLFIDESCAKKIIANLQGEKDD